MASGAPELWTVKSKTPKLVVRLTKLQNTVGDEACTLLRAFVLIHQRRKLAQKSSPIYTSLDPKNAFSAVWFAERKPTIIIKIGKVPVPFSNIRSRGSPIFRHIKQFSFFFFYSLSEQVSIFQIIGKWYQAFFHDINTFLLSSRSSYGIVFSCILWAINI